MTDGTWRHISAQPWWTGSGASAVASVQTMTTMVPVAEIVAVRAELDEARAERDRYIARCAKLQERLDEIRKLVGDV